MEGRICRCRKKRLSSGNKSRVWLCLMMVVLMIPIFPLKVRADMGPKPSVNLTFEGLEDEKYYVTLVTKQLSCGPWDMNNEYAEWSGEKEVWDKFKSFSGTDGYFFLGYFEEASETDRFSWTYYPPETFRILIYFSEADQLVVSDEVYKTYAFDSYFTVDMSGFKIESVTADLSGKAQTEELSVKKSYDFTGELVSFFCRVVATILIELAIAWVFRYCRKSQMKVIALTNVVTQILLNILLSVIRYKAGGFAFVLGYVFMELLVFVIEGVTFAVLLNKPEKTGKLRAWMYALVANTASFWIGMEIAKWLPGIF